jgi:hypothetical protein
MHYGSKRNRKVVRTVVQKEVDTKVFLEVDMCVVMVEDMEEWEVEPPHVLIMVILVMSHGFIPNYMSYAHIFIVLSMSLKTF